MPDPQDPHLSGVSGGGEAHRTPETRTLLPELQPLAGPGAEPGTEAALPHLRPSLPALLRSVVWAVLGFVAAAVVVHFALPSPLMLYAQDRSDKLALMQQTRGNLFSAAFGSSHMHNGFDPRAFDRDLAASPLQTETANFAVLGGSQSEQRVMALQFVSHMQAPPRSGVSTTCFVMLELGAGANFTNDHLVHPRAINIYDRDNAVFVNALTSPKMPLTERLGRRAFADIAMALHYMNVGMLSNALLPNITFGEHDNGDVADGRRGLLVIPRSPAEARAVDAQLAAQPRTGTASPSELLPGNFLLIQQLLQAQDVKGVQYVYLVMPKFADLARHGVYPPMLSVSGQTVPIIDLARPDLYPQLYRPGLWLDDAHLNEAGAGVAATLVAEQLKTFALQHPIPACGS